ncbi:MAG: hypothetical protein EA343_09100 [Nodularia sp. (in: Bacteria)]|nr:MAG: hypothetical protein EA343_09100 [Nodularia sp. (in: cyanobacteria)]
MAWHPYDLDREAQTLVLKYREKEVLNESHKMRVTAAYGLERFWGEHLRLMAKKKEKESEKESEDYLKGEYWQETWEVLVKVMKKAGFIIPNEAIGRDETGRFITKDIEKMFQKLWDKENFPVEHQRVTLAVLTQLCDSLVWWTQRYKKPKKENY